MDNKVLEGLGLRFQTVFLTRGWVNSSVTYVELECFSKRIPPPRLDTGYVFFYLLQVTTSFPTPSKVLAPFPLFHSLVVQDYGTKTLVNFVNEVLYMCSPHPFAVQVWKKLSFNFHKTISL